MKLIEQRACLQGSETALMLGVLHGQFALTVRRCSLRGGSLHGAVHRVSLSGQFVQAVHTGSWYGQFAVLFADGRRYFMASFRPTFDY